MSNAVIGLEVKKSVNVLGCEIFELYASYEDGSVSVWGDSKTLRGAKSQLTQVSKQLVLSKSKDGMSAGA